MARLVGVALYQFAFCSISPGHCLFVVINMPKPSEENCNGISSHVNVHAEVSVSCISSPVNVYA